VPKVAAARPQALGFLYVDGHARACYGTRTVQKTHIARLKFPAPATMETWVADQDGGPVFMVTAEPSQSLAGELRRLLPDLRAIAGQGRASDERADRDDDRVAAYAPSVGHQFRIDHAPYRVGLILVQRGERLGRLGFLLQVAGGSRSGIQL
jgi:hypothetical protein